MPLDPTGRYLLTHDPTAAVLVTTRRIREGKRLGALEIRVRHLGCPAAAKMTSQLGAPFSSKLAVMEVSADIRSGLRANL